MTEPVSCTIASNNYLAFARVFAQSFLDHHPKAQVFTLIVDEADPSIAYQNEPFQVVFARELDIEGYDHLTFKYSLLELNTAVKPYFLEYLNSHFELDSICYFDPDIVVLDNLSELFLELDEYDLLLTPHILEPLRDDARPSERNILSSGVYNLGFLGVSFNHQTAGFLDWWKARLYTECRSRVDEGLFVDQRWVDLAPAFLSKVKILRDPGYNVAYWNLAHRFPHQRTGKWWIGDKSLRFFHFSGILPSNLERISKHQDRFTLSDRPELRPLFVDYRTALIRAGLEETKDLEYRYGSFDNGVPVPELARVTLLQVDPSGDRWADPFDTGGPDSYLRWLTEPVGTPSGKWLPRIALLLWQQRIDLQAAFPAPLDDSHPAFVDWLLSGEPQASGVDDFYLASLEQEQQNRPGVESLSEPPEAATVQTLTTDAGFESERQPQIPRLAMIIWEQRPDVQEAFVAPLGQSREAFARWYVTFARMEYTLSDELIQPTLRTMSLRDRLRSRAWYWMALRGYRAVSRRGSWRDLPGVVPRTSTMQANSTRDFTG